MKKDEHLTTLGKYSSRLAPALSSGFTLAVPWIAAQATPPNMLALSPPLGGLAGPPF